jgi:Lon protease-like protein
MKALLSLAMTWQFSCAVAFVPSQQHPSRGVLPSSSIRLFSSETDDAERMEMVRKLQKSFYSQASNDTNKETQLSQLQSDTGIMTNVPLWRVGWVEVPGRANCLNVHEGQYTHMFETILSGPQPWYVGHLHLPGGSQMARSGQRQYDLKTWRDEVQDETRFETIRERSAVVGTVMRITDVRRMADGRLTLLVHPMERFVVDRIVQSVPYSVADVQILPDLEEVHLAGDENFCKIARAAAVMKSFQYHDYEYDKIVLPLPQTSEYLPTYDMIGSAISKILPFAYYAVDDSSLNAIKDDDDAPSFEGGGFAGGEPPLEDQLQKGRILRNPASLLQTTSSVVTQDVTAVETLLWLALDDFCRSKNFALPEEILCLMPPDMDYLAMDPPQQRLSPKYPALRRQRRLSYAAPALIEATILGADMRQVWLNTPSTTARLRAVLERFQILNDSILGEFQ